MNLGAVVLAVLLTSIPAFATAGAMPEEVEECLDCHEDDSLEKEMGDGDALSLFVDGAVFAASVHSEFGCRECHLDVDLDDHPGEKEISGRGEYAAEASKVCSDCHSDSREEEEAMHRYLVSEAGGPSCSECHSVHDVKPVAAWKSEVEERAYCLSCHGKRLHLTLENGEELALLMEEGLLEGSVHTDHDCTDCHGGFGKETHFVRDFKNRREHSIALADTCRECHDEMYESFESSIHYSMLDRGNLAAPVCTDCHGFHSVGPKAVLETIAGVPCRRCHQEVFDVYSESMHGVARQGEGHLEAPICADCHQAHSVRPANWAERLREACVNCHDGVEGEHEEWLPNAGLHLDVVACPACHAPGADRGIDLQLYDGKTGEPMNDDELRAAIGGNASLGDAAVDGISSRELWDMLRNSAGEDGGSAAVLHGRLKVRDGIDAHRMSSKGEALGECDSCHRDGAAPFESVTVSLLRVDGRPLRYGADSDVLTSVASVASVGDFYALGSTRIRILDFMLIAAVLGGMSLPALHMTARILAGRK